MITLPSTHQDLTCEVAMHSAQEQWAILRLIDERSGEACIGIDFPTALHGQKFVFLDNDLGENPEKARLALKRKGAQLTGKKAEQVQFIRELFRRLDKAPIKELTCKPGFRDGGFVLGTRMFGTAREKYRWRTPSTDDQLGESRGSKSGWDASVGRIALSSSFLTLAIAIPLAACLPGYYRSRGSRSPISETATPNFSGESSTGRTTISRGCAGVYGSPEHLQKWEFSRRGLEEICDARNDLVVVLDDTEKIGEDMTPRKAIRMVTQIIPDGTSKIISATARKNDLPSLRWSAFGVSSSPKSLDELAIQNGWKRSRGEQVRMPDIAVPDRKHAGIFDNLSGTRVARIKQGQQLILELENGIAEHFGVVLPEWIQYLLAEDRTPQLSTLTDLFVRKLVPSGDAWGVRFARKWGLIFAAAELARKAGILPWPKRWPARAVARCYRRALRQIDSDYIQATDKLRSLAQITTDSSIFPLVKLASSNVVRLQEPMIGITARLDKQAVCAMREDRFLDFAGGRAVRKEMIAILRRHGAIVGAQGHAQTRQLPISAVINGQTINRPRFLVIDSEKLRSAANAASFDACVSR